MAATVHLTLARSRRWYDSKAFCELHAGSFINGLHSPPEVWPKKRHGPRDAICFDPELVAYDANLQRSWIYLHELGGQRCFPVMTGPIESTALERELKGEAYPRPLTHNALAAVIAALGAELRDVIIDQFIESDHAFHAKLRLESRDVQVMVDVRPSDAIVLALLCNVPIAVSSGVVDQLFGA